MDFGELNSTDPQHHTIELSKTSASVDSLRTAAEHTRRQYYDLTRLSAGAHTITLVQVTGVVRTLSFVV